MAIHVRAAKAADIKAVYDRSLPHTARAWIVEEGDKILGIFGYYMPDHMPVVFSNIVAEESRSRRMTIARLARQFMAEIRRPMICFADENEPCSRRFLEWLGWQHMGPSDQGEVYLWQTH